jgi:hypothetical protein
MSVAKAWVVFPAGFQRRSAGRDFRNNKRGQQASVLARELAAASRLAALGIVGQKIYLFLVDLDLAFLLQTGTQVLYVKGFVLVTLFLQQ